MTEADVIRATSPGPITRESLARDLRALGLRDGLTVIVHTALSKLGWICGGEGSLILALEDVLTPRGNLVMPAHSGHLSDPAYWENPPVPQTWWEEIRASMPAFDPDLTSTRGVGVVPETFRKQHGVLRSNHPQVSFAAWGEKAEWITANHSLHNGLGDQSPLARVYDLDGWVLLLGVGHGNNTSLHLSENRAEYPTKKIDRNGAPIIQNGERCWVEIDNPTLDSDDFPQIGADFARETGLQKQGVVGMGTALWMPQRALVDFGVEWLVTNRIERES